MRWLNICLLFLIQRTCAISIDKITWTGLFPKPEDTALPRILVAVGGVPELKSELTFIINEASSNRNVTSSLTTVHLQVGTSAIVSKICFDDGICWALKMYVNRPGSIFDQTIDDGITASSLVRRYCPYIPINTPRGCGVHKLRYCFTDWIEGESLFQRYFPRTVLAPGERATVTIPQKTVSALAEFVYNLTTCPIPETERIHFLFRINCSASDGQHERLLACAKRLPSCCGKHLN